MSKYNSGHELATKMDSEGGLAEMLFGYGLNKDDLPDDMPNYIRDKLFDLLDPELHEAYREVGEWLWQQYDADPSPGDWDYE